jgi:hypothetical protein
VRWLQQAGSHCRWRSRTAPNDGRLAGLTRSSLPRGGHQGDRSGQHRPQVTWMHQNGINRRLHRIQISADQHARSHCRRLPMPSQTTSANRSAFMTISFAGGSASISSRGRLLTEPNSSGRPSSSMSLKTCSAFRITSGRPCRSRIASCRSTSQFGAATTHNRCAPLPGLFITTNPPRCSRQSRPGWWGGVGRDHWGYCGVVRAGERSKNILENAADRLHLRRYAIASHAKQ